MLRNENKYIEVGEHGSTISTAICLWYSLGRLGPGERFGNDFIETVPRLMEVPVDCRTFLLSSYLYSAHLQNRNFERADHWVRNIPRAKWVFGICENTHWVAVEIDWELRSIRYYDPKGQTNTYNVRRMATLEVSVIRYPVPTLKIYWPARKRMGQRPPRRER